MNYSNEYMPRGGAKELSSSAEGRRYLQKLQKKHELDILQPSDPRFEKIYGERNRRQQEIRQKQESRSDDEYATLNEQKKWKREYNNPLRKKVIL